MAAVLGALEVPREEGPGTDPTHLPQEMSQSTFLDEVAVDVV